MDSVHHFQLAEQAVLRLTGKWRGAPPVTVVPSARDLPFAVPDDTRGAFLHGDGKAYIVANSQSLDLVPDTVAHEAIGHFGMRVELGRNWRSFMDGIQAGARKGDWRLHEFRHVVRQAYVDGNGHHYLSSVSEADEVAAAVVETYFRPDVGRILVKQAAKKRIAAALGHINREVLYRDWPVSFNELLGRILAAEHRLRHGGQFFGLGKRIRDWYAPRMPKFNPRNPPMSLAESERLLRSEAMRLQGLEDWKAMGILLSGIFAFLALIALIGWCGLLIADLFGKLASFLS